MQIVLCADDYGLAPGIGLAIRDLFDRGRLSATSCICTFSDWPQEAALLKPYSGSVDIGLHLVFTDQTPLGQMPVLAPHGRLPSLRQLAMRSMMGNLPLDEIDAELERQWSQFEAELGCFPDHIDGHHHAHLLPGIAERVLSLVSRKAAGKTAIVTIGQGFSPWRRSKSFSRSIALLGFRFPEKVRRSGLCHNVGFSNFDADTPSYFDSTFNRLRPGPAHVKCHPGRVDQALLDRDSLTFEREREWQILVSPEFGGWLKSRSVGLARFHQINSQSASDDTR
jgi:predicted glycoside hydrolase/deacetylase ChbG (UPF0249 family)